jgi:spore coat protein A, manganese oxidase
MRLTRRRFLKLGLMASTGIALPVGALQIPLARLGAGRSQRSPAVAPFTVPLPSPPVLQPVRTDASTDYYEIVQKPAKVEILPGHTTEVWGYNGIFPGPTIEARSGRTVVVRQINELPVPVSTHLHGGVTPADSDGYPTDLILPQGWDPDRAPHTYGGAHSSTQRVKDYRYPNAQRGATLWYHDHRMDFTGPQVYRGLAGFYLLRDAVEDALPLPKGEKDIPLMIADRTFNELRRSSCHICHLELTTPLTTRCSSA